MSVQIAGQQSIRPKFEIEELKGMIKKKVFEYVRKVDELTKKVISTRIEKTIEVPAGFNVYTARGGMIHFFTKAEMFRAGFENDAEMVDMESGEVVPVHSYSLKALAKANGISQVMNRQM